MSGFEHLLTMVSFVLALSMTTILRFCAMLYRRRAEVRLSAPHALWTLIIFLNQISFWLGAYNFSGMAQATYLIIVFVVLQPVILFLQSALVVTGDQGALDLKAHHAANGRAYMTLCLLGAATETAFMARVAGAMSGEDLSLYYMMQGAAAAAILAAMFVKARAVQLAAPALLLAIAIQNTYFASETLVGAR